MLTGLNHKMISTNVSLTNKKLVVGGGLKNNLDLKALRNIKSDNLEGVIAGKARPVKFRSYKQYIVFAS